MERYGGQFGEFVCGYWGLKGVKYELAWELSLHLR